MQNNFFCPVVECYCNAAPIPFDRYALIPSVTPSAAFICSMMVSIRSCACSFRSARYVHSSPVNINVFNLAGWTSLKYSRCIRPYFPMGRCSFWQFQIWDVVISDKDIINSVFCYSWFQFAHVPYLLWMQARLVLTQSHIGNLTIQRFADTG